MKNHYEVLGLHTSASAEEIRRAYRILARRYHPDVNPQISSADKFKTISIAYRTLSDTKKRAQYDIDLEKEQRDRLHEKIKSYQKQQAFKTSAAASESTKAQSTQKASKPPPPKAPPRQLLLLKIQKKWTDYIKRLKDRKNKLRQATYSTASGNSATADVRISKISIVEVSIGVEDAILGVKKTIEISEPGGLRKVSVAIPSGVRNGSVVRLRSKGDVGEDLVLIIRVASHPFLRLEPRGIIMEVPVTIGEVAGEASIKVPTLEESALVKIPPDAQSGTEIRLKEKGVKFKDGSRGDFFVRLLVQLPGSLTAHGLLDRVRELELYYEKSLRSHLPRRLFED